MRNNGTTAIVTFFGMLVTALVAAVVGLGLLPALNEPTNYVGNSCFQHRRAIEHVNNQLAWAWWPGSGTDLEKKRSELFQQAADDKCAEDVKRIPGAPPNYGEESEDPADDESEDPADNPTTANGAWIHWFTKDPGKTKPRNFGPPVVVNNGDEAGAEFLRRIKVDPALNCEDGGLIINDPDETLTCTTKLMKSQADNEAYASKVMDNIQSIDVLDAYPTNSVKTAYMTLNQDGIPVVTQVSVPRNEAYKVMKVTTTDGRVFVFVFLCGIQWEEGTNFSPPAAREAATVTHKVTERTKHITTAETCTNGGERREDGSCEPPKVIVENTPSPSVQPSASPSAPSSEPASASPTPTPSPTPSSTPSTPPAETCTWEDGSEHPLNSQGDCPKDQGADQADGVEEPADNPSTPSAEPTPEPNEAPLEPSTGTDDADAGTDGNAGAEDVPEQDQGGDGSIADS